MRKRSIRLLQLLILCLFTDCQETMVQSWQSAATYSASQDLLITNPPWVKASSGYLVYWIIPLGYERYLLNEIIPSGYYQANNSSYYTRHAVVLHSTKASYTFSFALNAQNLDPYRLDTMRYQLWLEGKLLAFISRPYAVEDVQRFFDWRIQSPEITQYNNWASKSNSPLPTLALGDEYLLVWSLLVILTDNDQYILHLNDDRLAYFRYTVQS